jgi:ketosteroid isomerase-like protein
VVTQLHTYIDAWRRHDVDAVLSTLTDDCVVIEAYGPVYRGRPRVKQWMHAWFAAGGRVDAWDITTHAASGEFLMAEWSFECTWRGQAGQFEGSSIARLHDDRIAYLREYATTAPLYDWTGTWRDQQ